jgi:serine/threonine-protein kinase
VLERGLAKDPDDRWPSAMRFVDALERTLDEQAEPTKPTRRLFGGPASATSPRAEPAGGGHPPARPAAATSTPSPHGGEAPPPRRRRGAPILAGLAALVLVAVIGAIALANRGDGGGEQPRAQSTPEATAEPTETATAEETATPEETATEEQTASPSPSPDPTEEATQAPSGEPDLQAATQLQVEGFNARRAGDFETALAKAEEALQACGGAKELSPCGYALFEKGAALNGLGRSEEAIPILEQRLDEYGDNERGEVERELKDARKNARKGD